MLTYLKQESNLTLTENGALTYRSSQNKCLNFFNGIGASRNSTEDEIIKTFAEAYLENSDMAMKILFFGRDIRGGLGERRVFRLCLQYLARRNPKSVLKNLESVIEFGRYDDVLCLLDTPCEKRVLQLIKEQLEQDKKGIQVSLLAKWLPSINTSSLQSKRQGKKIAEALGMTECTYRKTLSNLRRKINILENHLREKEYSFSYEKQPSKALFKYKSAFIRNDNDRYMDFLSKVSSGKAVLKTGSLYPYDIIRQIIKEDFSLQYHIIRQIINEGFPLQYDYMNDFMQPEEEVITEDMRMALDVSWRNLTDYSTTRNSIAVIDGSGSMYQSGAGTVRPIDVAVSLGIYFAEHNTGKFANHFITFSETPTLVEIKGDNIVEKAKYAAQFNEVANTDIEKMFDLLLETAVKNQVPQEELPNFLYIISDMEFDCCAKNSSVTNYENAKNKFQEAGYQLPNVVFWNVNCRMKQVPVRMHDSGTALVSGCTPKIFEMVQEGNLNPMDFMLSIIEGERYSKITA